MGGGGMGGGGMMAPACTVFTRMAASEAAAAPVVVPLVLQVGTGIMGCARGLAAGGGPGGGDGRSGLAVKAIHWLVAHAIVLMAALTAAPPSAALGAWSSTSARSRCTYSSYCC